MSTPTEKPRDGGGKTKVCNSQQLLVRSSDRISGGTSTNYVVQLPNAFSKVKSIGLLSASIPSTQYNVPSALKVDMYDGTLEETVTVPQGTYTTTSLAAVINGFTFAASDIVTCTYSTLLQKFVIGSDGGTFALRWSTGGNAATSAAELLGFDGSADDTGAVSYTADTPPFKLSNPSSYLIDIAEFRVNNTSSIGQAFTFTVPNMVNSGEICQYVEKAHLGRQTINFNPEKYVERLSVVVRDQDHTAVDLNGSEWDMTLEIVQEL